MKDDMTAFSFFLLLSMVDPQAAIGAAFGSAFFLSTRSSCSAKSGIMLTIVSLGSGYSLGVAAGGDHRMWVALAGAALGSTLLGALHHVIKNGGDAPEWFKYTLDSILRLRK